MDLLIEELMPSQAGLITESSTDGKNVWLSGVFMQSTIKNRNGRVYPLTEISEAVNTAVQRIKESNGIFGELDHPQTLTINLDRVSHVITEVFMKGNDVIGKAKILDTPMGLIAKELIKSGVAMGVSSRGAGNVNESGEVSGFQFVTVDIVCTPSAPGAVPSVMYESVWAHKNGQRVLTLAEQVKEDPAAQKYFKKAFMDFLNENLFAKKSK